MTVRNAAEAVRKLRSDPMAFLESVLTHPDGRSYGRNLDPWQREDFEAAFREPSRHVWWERPRGHSKTQDAAALALVHLVTAPGRRVYFAAADRDQAGLAFDSLRGFVTRSPLLSRIVTPGRWSMTIESTDSRLEVLPADAPGSWGLRPSLIVVDEIHAWRGQAAEEFFWSLLSALGKVPGARMLVATTAGWDRTSLAWKVREQIREDHAWIFSRRGQCASWIKPEFLEQQRRLLPAHVYQMLHENVWTDAGGAFLTWEEVNGIFDPELRPVESCRSGHHWIGLDLGLTRDRTVAFVLHWDGQRMTAEDVRTWTGRPGERVLLEDVEAWVLDAARRFSAPTVMADPWQAVGLLQRLSAAGVRVREVSFTAQFRGRLYQNLLQVIRERRLRCFSHEALKDELLRLEFRDVNGVLRVDHPAGGHDDHAVALALAALGAAEATGAAPLDEETRRLFFAAARGAIYGAPDWAEEQDRRLLGSRLLRW